MAADLVTLEEYKAYMGISSSTQDTEISAIIPKVSQLVKTLCRRTFVDYVNDAKTETYSGGTGKFYLKEYPILSIIGIEFSTDYGQTSTSLIEYIDYVLDEEDGTIISTAIDSYGDPVAFTRYINGYKITYTAGYEELPEDLKLAVLDLVTYYMKHDSAIHSTKSPGSNTVQIEYVTSTKLPSHISRVLDLYTASFD